MRDLRLKVDLLDGEKDPSRADTIPNNLDQAEEY